MKTIEVSDAAASLAKFARSARKQPVLLTENGEPVAALIGIDAMDIESFSLSTNPKFLAIIEKSRAQYRKEGGVSSEVVRQRLKKARKAATKPAVASGSGRIARRKNEGASGRS